MKSTIKSSENCVRVIDIAVNCDVVNKKFDLVYDQIQKSVRMPGYRPGKVPRDIVEKNHRGDAQNEVLKDLIPEYYAQALSDHKLNPVDLPAISDIEMKLDGSLSFKATVSVRPSIKLADHKGVKIKKPKAAVTDEDVSAYLASLQEMNARYTTVVPDRPTKKGDYVICDLKCTIEGKCTDDRKKAWVFIDDKHLAKGLAEGLVDVNPHEKKTIDITLPKDYAMKEFAGKQATFEIELHEIKLKELPALDDEFAKEMGEFKTLDELKNRVRQDIAHKKEHDAQRDTENQMFEALLAANAAFDLPASLVERQLKGLVEDAQSKLAARGFKKEDIDKRADEIKKGLEVEARKRVRLYFILDEISRIEKISVSDADIEEAIRRIAAQTKRTFEDLKSEYEKKDLIDNLAEDIKEGKTVDAVLKLAVIEEA